MFTPDLMALVGFHLVFATPKHKEMIWAIFEHVANAPNGPCKAGVSTPPPKPYTTWTFNNPAITDCENVNAWPPDPSKPPPTQPPFPVTQAVRVSPFGGDSNIATINALNQSVASLLPANSVWQNYFLVGAIWTDGTLPAKKQFGSTSLSNATMETFTQSMIPNCFGCHDTFTTNRPAFTISHAVGRDTTSPCSYTTVLPPACSATQK